MEGPAISAPVLLYARAGPGRSRGGEPAPPPTATGLLLAGSVVLAVANARYVVFDAVALLAGPHPSEGLVLGALVLAMAAGLVPLVILLRPPTSVVGGAVCPKLPLGLCPRLWDEAHFPSHESDDASIYGAMDYSVQWPAWLLVLALLLGLAAMPGTLPRGKSKRAAGYASLVPALGSACMVGVYIHS